MDYYLIQFCTSGFKVRESCFAEHNFERKSKTTQKNASVL